MNQALLLSAFYGHLINFYIIQFHCNNLILMHRSYVWGGWNILVVIVLN